MNQSKRVWQVGSGGPGRSYVDYLIKHGVALIGPGDAGPWGPETSDQDYGGPEVRQLARGAQAGDIVLLRRGRSEVCAVGIVDGDYLYLDQCDDVNGWDLQHARRVRWYRVEQKFSSSVFGSNPRRFSRVWSREATEFAHRFIASPPTHWQEAPLPALPEEKPALDNIPAPIQDIVAEAQDLYPLLWDRERFGEHPAEDEMVAHFVVPLLRVLGWPPERIAVKWRHIDVSLFLRLPRTPENCHLVIEAKRLGAGIEGALEQARRYVASLGVPRDVMVTDGVRYRLYSAAQDFAQTAYANLARLKQSSVRLFDRLKRP